MADQFRYAAALRHPRFVRPQMKTNLDDMFEEGVLDFDCQEDYATVKHFPDLNNVGSGASPGFSFELWIRIRYLPEAGSSFALFCKKEDSGSHYYCLSLSHAGALSFVVQSSTRFEIKTSDEEIKPEFFYHVAITGAIGSSVNIILNGESKVTSLLGSDITTLPGHSGGNLVLGKDSVEGSLKHFCGQITAFYIYDRLRSESEINTDKFKRSNERGGTVCSFDFTGKEKRHVINYYITDKYLSPSEVLSNPKILPNSYDSSPVPLKAITVGRTIVLFYQNTQSNLEAKRYTVSVTPERSAVVEDNNWSLDTGGISVNKGLFSAIYHSSSSTWILVILDSKPNGKLYWKMYDNNFVPKTPTSCAGSFILKNEAHDPLNFDTHPDVTLKGSHLIVSAGERISKSAFVLDLLLKSDGCLDTTGISEIILPGVGPESNNWGANYYVYLGDVNAEDSLPVDTLHSKKSSGSAQLSYLRRKHATITHPMTYEIEEAQINPSIKRPAGAINEHTASNDWSWFLFRISSPNGGSVLQSGQRVLVQAPDNDISNRHGWVQLKVEDGKLKADTTNKIWNFVIFKVDVLSPNNFKAVPGEIFIDSEVVLLPLSSNLYRTELASDFFPLLTEAQISAAKRDLPHIFKPWKLLVPPANTDSRPLPSQSEPPDTHFPTSVQEGNRLTILSRQQSLDINRVSSGIWGGILNFARTVSAPSFSKDHSSSGDVHLIFRGNGVSSHIYSDNANENVPTDLLRDVYQEGSYAQNHISAGLFYSIEYRVASDSLGSAKVGHLNHIQNLQRLEHPTVPSGFVWLVAPPFKIMGMTGEVAQFYNSRTFSVNFMQDNKLLSFYQVSKDAVGSGTFGEGIFKPLLTIPIDTKKLSEIAEDLKNQIWDRIEQHVPSYDAESDDPQFQCPDPARSETWCVLGDFYVSRAFEETKLWEEKVNLKLISSKMEEEMKSQWMKNFLQTFYENNMARYFRDEIKKYSAYGGFAKLIANNLLNPPFLRKVMKMTEDERAKIIKSQLKILHCLDPQLSAETMASLTAYLLAEEVLSTVSKIY